MTQIVLARIASSVGISPYPPIGDSKVQYEWTFVVTGNSAPYKVALTGTLPSGLSFLTTSNTVLGQPTESGTFPLTVTLTGSDRIPVSIPVTITIRAPYIRLAGEIVFGLVGAAATGSLTASGGVGPYVLTDVTGDIPPGATFSMASGVITASGTTTTAGTYVAKFNITDSDGTLAVIAREFTVGVASTSYSLVTDDGKYLTTDDSKHIVTEPS